MSLPASECRFVIVVDDIVLLPPLLALREHLVGTEGVNIDRITMAFASPLLAGGVPMETPSTIQSLQLIFAISPRPLWSILLDQASLNTPLNVIWSDVHIAHDAFQELRYLMGLTSQVCEGITLSLATDGSANRATVHSEQELMDLLQIEVGQIRKGCYYSYGFISSDTADRRPSFHHKVVSWDLVGCYFHGSELWKNSPYPDLAGRIDAYVGSAESVIWVPMRAICNKNDYHDGNYHFGHIDPVSITFGIYRRLLDLLIGAKSGLADAPVVFVGDMRTEAILRERGEEAASALIGKNILYLSQPLGVRFDFLFADFVRRFPDAHNYVMCGDSTTAIPLCGNSYHASFLFGYPKALYMESGASEGQFLYAENRTQNIISDAMTVLFAAGNPRSPSLRLEALDDVVYLLDVHRKT